MVLRIEARDGCVVIPVVPPMSTWDAAGAIAKTPAPL